MISTRWVSTRTSFAYSAIASPLPGSLVSLSAPSCCSEPDPWPWLMPESLAYQPGPSPNEAFARDGSVRELYRELLGELAERDLGALERRSTDRLSRRAWSSAGLARSGRSAWIRCRA